MNTSNIAKLACDFFIYNAGNLPASKVSWVAKHCLKAEDDFDPPPLEITEKSSNILLLGGLSCRHIPVGVHLNFPAHAGNAGADARLLVYFNPTVGIPHRLNFS